MTHALLLLTFQNPHVDAAKVEARSEEGERANDKVLLAKEFLAFILRPLTPEEELIVRTALYGDGSATEILASHEAGSVQRSSMQRLQPGQWLNDETMYYFPKVCLVMLDAELCAADPERNPSQYFSSHFCQLLFDEKNKNPSLRGKYSYNNVKSWSNKVQGKDIFKLRCIFCPINIDNLHWTLAVIFMEEKMIQYYDSLGGTDRVKLEGLLEYIKDEYKAKNGGEMNASEWKLVGCTSDTPRQLNGYDCGVFVCMFSAFITRGLPLTFQQEHVNKCRKYIALAIMKTMSDTTGLHYAAGNVNIMSGGR